MRMQDTEQVVCQLLFAALCRKSGMKWHGIAGKAGKTAKVSAMDCVESSIALQLLEILGRILTPRIFSTLDCQS